ncbi:hypothetical protein MXAN_4135 [Myxococcus xanthus DK 1622]|uniref:Uncharacterized protein n=1 Tax=Myxococcus xanthus (strain DK1622) TaxID=246197 RepID=Q1D4W3_MYXXD|nr:hypothetical protein MXAN_4135 [Myxococcus xanthus DK 1622]
MVFCRPAGPKESLRVIIEKLELSPHHRPRSRAGPSGAREGAG